jgi:hypothetical protein
MTDSSNDQRARSAGIHSASGHSNAENPGRSYPKGAMVILSPQPTKFEAPKLAAGSANSATRFRWSSRAALVAGAAAIGGVAGSLATAGIFHFTAPRPEVPSYYSALAESLGRVDHELTVLKSAIENSANATDRQGARLADRPDHGESTQLETGPKPANSADSIDRTEHRLAAASGDTIRAAADTRASSTGSRTVAVDTKQPSPAPIVSGWVVRDVYHGAALIQGRAGVVEVLPGDNLPGLGRIQQVTRQDGRWVVVTSRGQIVSR